MNSKEITIESITTKLIDLIAEKKEIEVGEINGDSNLNELGLDSMDQIDLIFGAEFYYDIKFPDDSSELVTLNDVARLTSELVEKK
jgi:acyl carrier protein